MQQEETPVYRRPMFWIGSGIAFFGLLLWMYPELLSILIGGFFITMGAVVMGRVLFQNKKFDTW